MPSNSEGLLGINPTRRWLRCVERVDASIFAQGNPAIFKQSGSEVNAVATDYDTPRKTDEELHEESLEELKAKRADAQSGQIDVDEAEAAENLELPGADLSGEQLAVRVVPVQVDEFTCSRCFLIHHITQLAKGEGAKAICKECA